MSDVERKTPFGNGETRRWSEPVRLGSLLTDLLAAIEACKPKAAPQGRAQTVVHVRLRKAG